MPSRNTQDPVNLSPAANFTRTSIEKLYHRPLAFMLTCSLTFLITTACSPKDQNPEVAANDAQPDITQTGASQPGGTESNLALTDATQSDITQPGATQQVAISEQQAKAIHKRIITLDSHVDIPREYMLKPEFDPGK